MLSKVFENNSFAIDSSYNGVCVENTCLWTVSSFVVQPIIVVAFYYQPRAVLVATVDDIVVGRQWRSWKTTTRLLLDNAATSEDASCCHCKHV